MRNGRVGVDRSGHVGRTRAREQDVDVGRRVVRANAPVKHVAGVSAGQIAEDSIAAVIDVTILRVVVLRRRLVDVHSEDQGAGGRAGGVDPAFERLPVSRQPVGDVVRSATRREM
jgi:hypothetical protein